MCRAWQFCFFELVSLCFSNLCFYAFSNLCFYALSNLFLCFFELVFLCKFKKMSKLYPFSSDLSFNDAFLLVWKPLKFSFLNKNVAKAKLSNSNYVYVIKLKSSILKASRAGGRDIKKEVIWFNHAIRINDVDVMMEYYLMYWTVSNLIWNVIQNNLNAFTKSQK